MYTFPIGLHNLFINSNLLCLVHNLNKLSYLQIYSDYIYIRNMLSYI